jgi:lysophospholipase L1-like esterase
MMKTLLALGIFLFCLDASAQEIVPLFVGDSLTCGLFPRYLGGEIRRQEASGEKFEGYPGKILEGVAPDSWRVACRPGARVSEISRMLDQAIDLADFTHVVILAGVNDCHGAVRGTWKRVVEEIEEMILTAQTHGAVPVVVLLYPCNRRSSEWCESCGYSIANPLKLYFENRSGALDPIIVDAMTFVPRGDLDESFDAGDGIHLNGRGDFALATIIAEAIETRRSQCVTAK